LRRASTAASLISFEVTENGEQGATAICSIDSGDGSWNRSIASSVAASAASVSSTTLSGGSPPSDCPRSIDPRVGWNRTPICCAASISAASTSPPSFGKT
jgi:hypothetical protein